MFVEILPNFKIFDYWKKYMPLKSQKYEFIDMFIDKKSCFLGKFEKTTSRARTTIARLEKATYGFSFL